MLIDMRCCCGARLVLGDVPEDWAVGVASQFVAAHAQTCCYASTPPDDAASLEEPVEPEVEED